MKNQVIHLKNYYSFLGKNGKDATLTLYLPYNMKEINRQNDKRPCILVCPGGGYSFCSEREAEPIAINFLNYGYNVFVLNYSVAPHIFPSALLEVAASMDLIAKNENEWNSDSSRVAIIGFSAGGHLACHYSNCYDIPEVREYFKDSIPVQASILCYPVISADKSIAHIGSFQNLFGKEELTKEETEKFSLENRVSSKTPPTYIWHTAEDNCVPVYNSLVYAKALSDNKIPYELHIYPYGWHGLSTVDGLSCDYLEEKMKLAHSWISEVNKWLKFVL